MGALIPQSVLTCPRCGFAKQETMPTDACQFYYECSKCKALLRPNPGDCCVVLLVRFGEMPADSSETGALRIERWPMRAMTTLSGRPRMA